jgi:hypothetical protein
MSVLACRKAVQIADAASRSRGASRPGFAVVPSPFPKRGRAERRVPDAPAASCAKVESARVRNHGGAGIIRRSARGGGKTYCVAPPAVAPDYRRLPGSRLPPHDRPLSERSQRPTRPHLVRGNRTGTIHAFRRPVAARSSSGALFDAPASNAASRPPHPAPRS